MNSSLSNLTLLWMFQKPRPEFDPSPLSQSDLDNGIGRLRIRCPLCHWQPRKNDLWSCLCGHVWNTFDTGGKCPNCHSVWENTQCLHCHQWSKHDAWYEWNTPHSGERR